MKTIHIVKCTVLSVTLAVALSTTTSYAEVHPSVDAMKVQPSTVFQAIRGKSLAETLSQITQRSGITFKIDTDLHQDVVSQSIDADNWSIAVRSLLTNYNFVTIQKSDTIKTVIISSRNNDAADPVITNTPVASAEYVIEIEPPLTVMEMEHERSDEYY